MGDVVLAHAMALFAGVREYVETEGLSWDLLPLHYTEEGALPAMLRRRQVAGVIGAFLSDRWVDALRAEGEVPFVNTSTISAIRSVRSVVVDDEADILESLCELLDSCDVDTAPDVETARHLLINNHYDAAILDIMGVRGYDLLNLAKVKGIPAMMLTAHALSPEHLEEAVVGGARCYLPKDAMIDIADHLCDVLLNQAKASPTPHAWFAKLAPCFERKWGVDWQRERMESLRRLNLIHSRDELEAIL